jgi:phosphoribosylamine--glycine ligase
MENSTRPKVLIVGSGGREHAMAAKLAKSAHVYCAPGNPGMESVATCVSDLSVSDVEGLLSFAINHSIYLTVVGPELPLTLGIVDRFQECGMRIFGPTKQAAEIEGSKVFAKDLMLRNGIPTAETQVFTSTDVLRSHLAHLDGDNFPNPNHGRFPLVIKADGLAAGKGVGVCRTHAEAEAFINRIDSGEFGNASDTLLLEEFLKGEEASYIVMVDKNGNILPWASAQDHKPVFDNDEGPNTGGMGAYSPAPVVTAEVEKRILERIIRPMVKAMADIGRPFTGFLYAGLMIDAEGNPSVVEFNCRPGDPETQPILVRLENDLLYVLEDAVGGTLDQTDLEWDPDPAVCIVAAAKGYPGTPEKGQVITGIDKAEETAYVFHAGTARNAAGELVTAGGRVLSVTATGRDFQEAVEDAYDALEHIQFEGMHHRRDIGYRAAYR